MLATNVTAVMVFVRAFGPGLRSRDAGHVIVMGSIAGHEAYEGGSVYCATKHAVRAFTDSARRDFVATGVRWTAVSPGAVNTEFSTVRFGGDKARADQVYDGIPLGPLLAEDVADSVMHAALAPAHVQVADIVLLATYQCSAKGIARR